MRVLIADDSVLLREGLALILADGGHEVVGGVGTGDELVSRCLSLRPDLTISDIRMPPSHTDEGLRACVRIRETWAQAPILLLSQYIVLSYATELLSSGSGSIGYLLKDRVSDLDSFFDAVERVGGGGMVLDPEVVAQLMGRGRRDDPVAALTPREREVLELMAEGHTNAGIARRLVVSEGAVEKHNQRIFAKLGLHANGDVHRRVSAVLTLLGA
ncbi:response regulator receiver domain protein [Actinobaculum sp. oral taxon 183 str. F0552]|uniref:LuxR C-terminal-related transcriptional regulator n=1 Tax=Actinobaculum sp. oral taxon 183 TaxID=712888 RepID=UPI000395FF5C|nr:response regulator transcription factor [Actinobaculum sp. oral taxon 183]ERH19239.1 response regulator receiver domain protein [Actinobaculum sp. oral taxon 183 str. F0552]RKV69380.1 MAG: DNA-binding response regulator [Actinomyces sp.]